MIKQKELIIGPIIDNSTRIFAYLDENKYNPPVSIKNISLNLDNIIYRISQNQSLPVKMPNNIDPFDFISDKINLNNYYDKFFIKFIDNVNEYSIIQNFSIYPFKCDDNVVSIISIGRNWPSNKQEARFVFSKKVITFDSSLSHIRTVDKQEKYSIGFKNIVNSKFQQIVDFLQNHE